MTSVNYTQVIQKHIINMLSGQNRKLNIVLRTCFIASLFLASFFIFTNPTQAGGLSEFVPAPEITNLEHGQVIPGEMTVEGMSINFSNISITLDGQAMGYAQAEIGNDGWQDWKIDLPTDLEIGEHKLEAVTEYFRNTYSTTTSIMFGYASKFPNPTLFDPVLNFETNYQQPWIVGLSYNDANLEIYLDEKLDGELLVENHQSGVTDFKYLPSQKLALGFHTVKVLAKHTDGRASDFSNEIIFEVRSGLAKMQAPDLPVAQGEFIPPVPAPTLVEPKQGLVTRDNKLMVTGLVHNEHYVKVFADDNLIGGFMPEPDESGVTSFTWQAEEPLGFGSHQVWAQAINPSGQPSGQSNILSFIVLPPEHFVSELVGKIAAATEDEPAADEQPESLVDKINGLMDKAGQWTNWWKYFIAIIVLVVIVLVIIWLMSFKKEIDKEEKVDIKTGRNGSKTKDRKIANTEDTEKFTEDTEKKDEPIILGPEIDYSDPNAPNKHPNAPNDLDEEFNERDESMPPPPPPIDSPTLGF